MAGPCAVPPNRGVHPCQPLCAGTKPFFPATGTFTGHKKPFTPPNQTFTGRKKTFIPPKMSFSVWLHSLVLCGRTQTDMGKPLVWRGLRHFYANKQLQGNKMWKTGQNHAPTTAFSPSGGRQPVNPAPPAKISPARAWPASPRGAACARPKPLREPSARSLGSPASPPPWRFRRRSFPAPS